MNEKKRGFARTLIIYGAIVAGILLVVLMTGTSSRSTDPKVLDYSALLKNIEYDLKADKQLTPENEMTKTLGGILVQDNTLKGVYNISNLKLTKNTYDFICTIPSEQQFFSDVDKIYRAVLGKDAVKSEKEFRAAVKKQIEEQLAQDSQYRFITDVRQYLTDRIGQVEWPDELLKRIMTVKNSDKPEDYVEKNYEGSIKELQWHLIKEQLADQTGIKVEQEDVLELAKKQTRMQFAQYGMSNVPDELITKYATENLKKQEQVEGLVARCVEEKLGEKLQSVVTLDKKTVTLDEFNKLYETNK